MTVLPDTGIPIAVPAARQPGASRIVSIDGLRGLVMLLMLVDHAREFFFIGHQVADPMDLSVTSPGLFFTRLAAHLCAPVFVVLTGLSAWLYGSRTSPAATSVFLLKRGLFLVGLEVTIVNFAWTFAIPPVTVFLQVIWAIGLSMLALAALVHLPRGWIVAIGGAIVIGHNLLDPIAIPTGAPGYALWAILHDRGYIELADGVRARTSYPVLPWIGVIAIGYGIGPWFAVDMPATRRRRNLAAVAIGLLVGFVVIRTINGYGEPHQWSPNATLLQSLMSFFNLTKYPPSLDLILLTLGVGASLLLVRWDRPAGRWLAVLGAAPLFFYVLHLYALHGLQLAVSGWNGSTRDVPSIGWVWAIAAMSTGPLWLATRWFATVKRTSMRWWMRYL